MNKFYLVILDEYDNIEDIIYNKTDILEYVNKHESITKKPKSGNKKNSKEK